MNTNLQLINANAELINETINRIILDFEKFGIELIFPVETDFAYDQLRTQLTKHINQLIKKDRAKLMLVLNRIDISEQKLKSAIKEYPDADLSEVLSGLVIEREFQKVLTVKIYKKRIK